MGKFFAKYKGALGLLVIILLGFWAYSSFFSGSADILFNDTEEPVGEELFDFLSVLRGIELDGNIFSSPDFLTLQDFETDVPAGITGRTNPFSPIGGDTGGVLVEPSYKVVPISVAETFVDTGTSTDDGINSGGDIEVGTGAGSTSTTTPSDTQ